MSVEGEVVVVEGEYFAYWAEGGSTLVDHSSPGFSVVLSSSCVVYLRRRMVVYHRATGKGFGIGDVGELLRPTT